MPQRNISRNECEISLAVEAGQRAMFRLAEKNHGLSLNILSLETGIPLGTLRSYAPAKAEMPATAMPVTALVKLSAVIPNELTSLMLDPGGKLICDAEPEETDIDDLARAAVDLLSRYVAARHPDSPGNIRIVHSEEQDIRLSAAGLKDKAGKVAA